MSMQRQIKRMAASLLMTTWLVLLFVPIHSIYAETADGYYEIDYEVLNAEGDSVSIANDYFEKPATLLVEDGAKQIQFSINHSEWVVGLQAPKGDDFVDVEVISEADEEDIRVVQFAVEEGHDLSEPIEMKMHIVVDVLEEDYDHHYSAQFAFDEGSMKEINAPEAEAPVEEGVEETPNDADESEAEAVKDDTKTENATEEVVSEGMNSGTLIVIILLASIVVILLYSFVFKKKK